MYKNKAITIEQSDEIIVLLKKTLESKMENYKPEGAEMPFHARLLGKDRLALYSFIHSLNTNFGTTIFEPVAKKIAEKNFKHAVLGTALSGSISSYAQTVIQEIIDGLRSGDRTPLKDDEIEAIKAVCQKGTMHKVKLTKIDLLLERDNGELFYFDIKTAKPNKGSFIEFKRTLLEWAAATLSENPGVNVNTLIAIPYNPYAPQKYERWTIRGMLDLEKELKVAEEFWDFLGGVGAYQDILNCFEKAGIEMRDEIDKYFLNMQK